jgi:hypothetical protein
MGLFDKLFNDDEKQKEDEAKRKAAEKYATDHAHGAEGEHEHAAAHTHAPASAPAAKKTTAKAAAPAAATAAAPAKKAAAPKKAAAAPAAAPVATIPHQHAPAAIAHQGTAQVGAVTVAHDQAMTIHILSHIPDHAPRTDDPHYHLFEQAKSRLKRQGLWKCIIGDELCDGEPELHHTFIEFSQINEVDPAKIQQSLGLHFDNDEDFQKWAESPGNLEVLCVAHHRAHYGIHVIPGPLWEALRFRKAGTAAAAEFVAAKDLPKDSDAS